MKNGDSNGINKSSTSWPWASKVVCLRFYGFENMFFFMIFGLVKSWPKIANVSDFGGQLDSGWYYWSGEAVCWGVERGGVIENC